MRLFRFAFAGLAVVLACRVVAASQPPAAEVCSFPTTEVEWLQRALNGWEQVSRDFLRVDPKPLPWIVLFDASCVWHLAADGHPNETRPVSSGLTFAGDAVPVRALRHNGTVLLPNGSPIPVELKASTSLYRNSRSAFFVLSMPSVWQTKEISATTRAEFLQGVFSHEMTHTRLLVNINRRVRELANKNDLVYPLNDDVIQTEFQRAAGFEAAMTRERDEFYRAALEPDRAKQRKHLSRALDLVRARHARYFKGPTAAYAELETLFMTLEGLGQWAAYRLMEVRAGGRHLEALRIVRDNRRYWSQDEGLALFLLIDQLVPNWQSRIFTATPASPFVLLEETLNPR